MPPVADITAILLALVVILVLARAVGWLFERIGQPRVVGEIVAGILLGPSLLGPGLSETLFDPLEVRPFLKVLASIGLVLFMFVVGLEIDVSLIKGRGRVAGSVSVASIVLPFTLGLLLATQLDDYRGDREFWPFALFIGASMSVTAFPVLARILSDRGMHRTVIGGLALACAATDDILAWTLLAVVIAIAGGEAHGNAWVVALAIPFAVLALTVVRQQLTRMTTAYQRAGRLTPGILSVVLVGLLLFAAITEYLGVHYIFGAFLFGAIIPREGAEALRHEILVRLEQVSVLLLLPVFFLVSGLAVDVRGLRAGDLLFLVAILAVAVAGKYVGAYVGARASGVPHWQASALGVLMNTRGLTELVILNVGRELGLLDDRLFTLLVIMAVVTTVMTGPLLGVTYPRRRVLRDIAEAERAALGDAFRRNVLVVPPPGADLEVAAAMVETAAHLSPADAEVVVADLEDQRATRLDLGSGLGDELASIAASMERLEELVRRGRARGRDVRIVTRPSADRAADLGALAAALTPDTVLVAADDRVVRAALEESGDTPVVAFGAGAGHPGAADAVAVHWTGGEHAEAALLAGVRLAGALDLPLHLVAVDRGRRGERALATLAGRGVRVADGTPARPWRVGAPGAADGLELEVRAVGDAVAVEWDEVALTP